MCGLKTARGPRFWFETRPANALARFAPPPLTASLTRSLRGRLSCTALRSLVRQFCRSVVLSICFAICGCAPSSCAPLCLSLTEALRSVLDPIAAVSSSPSCSDELPPERPAAGVCVPMGVRVCRDHHRGASANDL